MEWVAISLTLKLALVTTCILLVIGTPLAWWLAKNQSWYSSVIAAFVAMPLVLPPTVIGFYLLLLFGPKGAIGWLTSTLNVGSLAFTFSGLVLGSVIYSLPFVVQPLRSTFANLDKQFISVSSTLGLSPVKTFLYVVLPLSKTGFITAILLGFAHTLGEFGVVLMIGGAIPGETKVLSIAIYEHVEALEWGAAHALAISLVVFSFTVVFGLFVLEKRTTVRDLNND
ncbi:MAG: molybdate transport system permease protein [Lentisphaeria bacterium]|jgi:molybdate transport system permease protein